MFKEKLESKINRLLEEFGLKEEEVDFKIEIPPEGYGDLSTNVAFILSRSLKRNPREIAVSISEELRKDTDYSRVEVAGPGFINVDFSIDYLSSVLAKIFEQPGFWKKQVETNIQFEFASAN
ncbi:MAG: arginine--tRNA ligase, partial [Kosmotogaceae bacterium]